MSTAETGAAPGWRAVALWTVKGLVAAAFLAAGGAKLAGAPALVASFESYGLGQWFRHVTGAVEVTGAIAVLVPAVAPFGALVLSATMIGAIFVHLFVAGGSAVPALVLLLLSATIAWAERERVHVALAAALGTRA